MPTTIRVLDEDKEAINRLQARYVLATGKRISIERLLSLVLDFAEAHEDEIISRDDPLVIPEAEVQKIHRGIADSGRATHESQLDDILYGGAEPH